MRIYAGNLPYSTTEEQLNELFAAHGAVQSVAIITDKFSGQSKGFGFVEMMDKAQAREAITGLDGTDFGGRKLHVAEARPMPQSAPRSPGSGGRRGLSGAGFAAGRSR